MVYMRAWHPNGRHRWKVDGKMKVCLRCGMVLTDYRAKSDPGKCVPPKEEEKKWVR